MPGLSFSAYFALSSSLTALAVSYAFQSRVQFYPAVIYLVTSKPSVLVLGNMGTYDGKSRGRRSSVGCAASCGSGCVGCVCNVSLLLGWEKDDGCFLLFLSGMYI